MQISIQKIDPRATIPTYGSSDAAGADLYALTDGETVIRPHETVMIHTGIALDVPSGYAGFVYARSGMASKRNLAPANKVGVIDSDYRGEILVALHNHGEIPQTVTNGERIAQLVIAPVLHADFAERETLSETERASGGFGSTGTH